ncbi:hypothetical protein DDW09_01345 [Sulfolobus sp. SCGC AB-777_L09]|jgi:hypothetical protein|nr:hypothetical protein DDW09_01345 [Sulfolobus sp. SCGC AB-777_L09]
MRISEQFIGQALLLSLEMIKNNNPSLASKVWENTIKAIVAFAQEKTGKDVLALALGMSSISVQNFSSSNYLGIVKETLKVAEKIGIKEEEIRNLYEEVKKLVEERTLSQ